MGLLEFATAKSRSCLSCSASGLVAGSNSTYNALQALQAAVGEHVPGGVLVGGEGGRPVYWDSPQATPDGVGILHMHVGFETDHGVEPLQMSQFVHCFACIMHTLSCAV